MGQDHAGSDWPYTAPIHHIKLSAKEPFLCDAKSNSRGSHISQFHQIQLKVFFVLRIKSTNAIFIIATIKSPCCLPSFQFWITFQFHKISFSKSSKTTFLPQRASNQLTMLANVFLFCIFQLLHKKRVLWPISRFSRPCPSDEAMLLVSGKISASGKPKWLLCPGI